MIELTGVVKTYHSAAGDTTALKGINLSVYPGEFVVVTGKSGAGKTTLVNMITGTDTLTAGDVRIGDTRIHALSEDSRARWRGSMMGIVYQTFHLIPTLSLLNNVMLPLDFTGGYRMREGRRKAEALLNDVELGEHIHKLPAEVSGGQQQRVAIARALINDPPVIIADEPTGRLDSTTAELIYGIFQGLVERGKTIFMVTHDRSILQRSSRALIIRDGEVEAHAD